MNVYDEENIVISNKVEDYLKNGAFVSSHSRSRVSVARRNARERRRIEQVNKAFDDLRKRVPCGDPYRKSSKVETLRSAIEYIRALEEIVKKQKRSETLQTLDKLDEHHIDFDSNLWSEDLWNETNNFDVCTDSNRVYMSCDVTCASHDAEMEENTCQLLEHCISNDYESGNIQH